MKHYEYEKIKESLWGVGCWMSPDNFTKLSCWEVSNIFCPFETCHWHPSPIRLRHQAQPRMETVKYKVGAGWHSEVMTWYHCGLDMKTSHPSQLDMIWCDNATPDIPSWASVMHGDTPSWHLRTVQELHELHFIGGTDINDIEEIWFKMGKDRHI